MKLLKIVAGAACLLTAMPVVIAPAAAQSSENVPMYCALRAMGGQSRDSFVTDVFWGDYNNNLGYKNRFAAWVNAEYGSLGGQYATYCFYGNDVNQAYYKRDRMIGAERGNGNNVITTYWKG
jgi:hypothetical protein